MNELKDVLGPAVDLHPISQVQAVLVGCHVDDVGLWSLGSWRLFAHVVLFVGDHDDAVVFHSAGCDSTVDIGSAPRLAPDLVNQSKPLIWLNWIGPGVKAGEPYL